MSAQRYEQIIEELKQEFEEVLGKKYVPREKPRGKLLKGLIHTGIPKNEFKYLNADPTIRDLVQYELDVRSEIEFFQTGIENMSR